MYGTIWRAGKRPPAQSPTVAARDGAERIGAGQYGQSEGQRDAGEADAYAGKRRSQHGAAAAAQYEPEGADELGETFTVHGDLQKQGVMLYPF